MTAQEKAKKLIDRYLYIKMSPSVQRSKERAKECDWWREVKREIEKL